MSSEKRRRVICSQVARILQQRRMERGFSLSAVGQRAGLSHQMVSFVERELRNPTLDTLLRITEVLEIDLADVIRQASQSTSKD